jgi:AraC-like DNA-binding protein
MTERARLLESPDLLVEDLRASGVTTRVAPEDYSPTFQVCLPYRGAFVWHVGCDRVPADANQVLFVRAGEAFRVSQQACEPYGELIVTPASELLAELLHTTGRRLPHHPLFAHRRGPAKACLQRARARFLQGVSAGAWGPLAVEEGTLQLLRSALGVTPARVAAGESTRRTIARAREFLVAHVHRPIRLTDVARYAGVSPAYLTSVFRASEGLPVHRYLVQLRLSRALDELPRSPDLARLALDLGFSSHSHFTVAFRRAFGCTPSSFRRRPQGA